MKQDYKNKYYKPDYTRQIKCTEFKLEQLQLLRAIADIDAKLNALESMRAFYPAPVAGGDPDQDPSGED
jgi:hypothetical protein